ncbi:hypothetical protein DNK10_00070 [Pseudomonas daroniae]|nr:hypothetical protein DNK10_00070 [Pseudomonas daroniae]
MLEWAISVVEKNQDAANAWLSEFSKLSIDRVSEYLSIMSEYFESYNDFDQTLFYARFGLECEPDAHASANAFQSTKMFYGNAFEIIGSHLDLFVGLKNIEAGRSFDMLENISLEKYRKTDKGARFNAVKFVPELSFLVDEYDNSLRNASHHRWFRLAGNMQSIRYRKSGDGAEQVISYSDYTLRCNNLIMQVMIMYLCELSVIGYMSLKVK